MDGGTIAAIVIIVILFIIILFAIFVYKKSKSPDDRSKWFVPADPTWKKFQRGNDHITLGMPGSKPKRNSHSKYFVDSW